MALEDKEMGIGWKWFGIVSMMGFGVSSDKIQDSTGRRLVHSKSGTCTTLYFKYTLQTGGQ
jgi:hypothetical protein